MKIFYVIVEYSNGGMICYNYANGEIIFDNSIADNISLFDYVLEYFAPKEQSMYTAISTTYLANANIAESITSTEELKLLVGEKTDENNEDTEDSKYMTLYNEFAGVYEIANEEEYLTDNDYKSENEKLGVTDFSKYGNGFASATVDKGQEHGIIFYIVPVLMILAIAAGVEIYVAYRRSNNSEGA